MHFKQWLDEMGSLKENRVFFNMSVLKQFRTGHKNRSLHNIKWTIANKQLVTLSSSRAFRNTKGKSYTLYARPL